MKEKVDDAVKRLRDMADGKRCWYLEQADRDAIGWALSYAMEHCTYIAQPRDTKERAGNSPASPVQQLKAEIAATLEKGVYTHNRDNVVIVMDKPDHERLRQLSAV